MEKVNFEYDKQVNILFISYEPGFILNSPEDVKKLFGLVRENIRKIGYRVALISDLTHFRMKLDQKVLDMWKQQVLQLVKSPNIYGWVRYNFQHLDSQTGINLRVAQIQLDSPLYISRTNREDAIRQATELINNRRKYFPNLPYPEPLPSETL